MSYIGTKKIKSVYIGTQKVKSVYVGTNKVYSSETIEPYLTFTALQSNSQVSWKKYGSSYIGGLQYSLDGTTWDYWSYNNYITLANVGDKVYIRNTGDTLSTSNNSYAYFSMIGGIKASGNIMSLLNYSSLSSYCFYKLFYYCSSLKDISELVFPNTHANPYSFFDMFIGCTSITKAPELPSTTISNRCCLEMFAGCTSLIYAPSVLPATTLVEGCYQSMFSGCASLTTPPIILATTLANNSCYSMFYNCSSLKVNDTGTTGILFFTCPSTSSFSNPVYQMFSNTGGTYATQPVDNGTYFYY